MVEHFEDFKLEYNEVKLFDTEDYDFGCRFLLFTIVGRFLTFLFFRRGKANSHKQY